MVNQYNGQIIVPFTISNMSSQVGSALQYWHVCLLCEIRANFYLPTLLRYTLPKVACYFDKKGLRHLHPATLRWQNPSKSLWIGILLMRFSIILITKNVMSAYDSSIYSGSLQMLLWKIVSGSIWKINSPLIVFFEKSGVNYAVKMTGKFKMAVNFGELP